MIRGLRYHFWMFVHDVLFALGVHSFDVAGRALMRAAHLCDWGEDEGESVDPPWEDVP